MIETDKEITQKINRLKTDKKNIELELKFRIFMQFFNGILIIISTIYIAKIINNTFFISMIFFIILILEICYIVSLQDDYDKVKQQKEQINNEINDVMQFNTYLTSYRKIEALKHGFNIYPEIRENDAKWIVEHDKNMYEEKRIEYEKYHIGRLKLNKYYLDEKIKKMPIENYPIEEQELLKKRKVELDKEAN